MRRGVRDHLGPLILMAGLAVVWTWPLARHLSTHVTGLPGDNYSFLWNLWWMRHVVADRRGLLPLDVSLRAVRRGPHQSPAHGIPGRDRRDGPGQALDHPGRERVPAGRDLQRRDGNTLAVDITHDRRAGMLAAVMFGGSPFVFAHLLGHFDLLTAWPIPLFALCLRRALRSGSALAAAGCGAALAVAAYSAYYSVGVHRPDGAHLRPRVVGGRVVPD